LVKDKLVRESGVEMSTGGRPGRCLELEPERVAIGVEIQIRKTRCAICSVHGQLIASQAFSTPKSAEKTLENIAEVFCDFRNRLGANRIIGLGVCICGTVDHTAGMIVAGRHPDWINVSIRQILEAALGEPVFVESDIRAAALAEYNYGWRGVHGSHSFLYVRVDERLEGGVVLEGKLYQGPRMAAGRLGEMVVAMPFGPEPSVHSLQTLVSNPSINREYSSLVGLGTSSPEDPASMVREIAELATKGDVHARQVLENVGHYLGIAIANVAWVLDAEVIVIDGAIVDAWHVIEPRLLARLRSFRGLLVVASALKNRAALIGASMLPFVAARQTNRTQSP
jgi:glucokinase